MVLIMIMKIIQKNIKPVTFLNPIFSHFIIFLAAPVSTSALPSSLPPPPPPAPPAPAPAPAPSSSSSSAPSLAPAPTQAPVPSEISIAAPVAPSVAPQTYEEVTVASIAPPASSPPPPPPAPIVPSPTVPVEAPTSPPPPPPPPAAATLPVATAATAKYDTGDDSKGQVRIEPTISSHETEREDYDNEDNSDRYKTGNKV